MRRADDRKNTAARAPALFELLTSGLHGYRRLASAPRGRALAKGVASDWEVSEVFIGGRSVAVWRCWPAAELTDEMMLTWKRPIGVVVVAVGRCPNTLHHWRPLTYNNIKNWHKSTEKIQHASCNHFTVTYLLNNVVLVIGSENWQPSRTVFSFYLVYVAQAHCRHFYLGNRVTGAV